MPDPKEKLQYLNNLLSKLNLDGYDSLTEDKMEELLDDYYDSTKSARAARIERLKKIVDTELVRNTSFKIPEGADPLTYLFMEFRVLDTKDKDEIARYNRRNVEILNKFSNPELNPADKKALFDEKFRNLLGVNFKTITTGNDDEKLAYLHNIITTSIAFSKVPELIEEYKKIPGYNTKTVEALEEKLGLFQAIADYMEYASIYSHPGYTIAEKLNPQQLDLIKDNDEVKQHINSKANNEEWTSNLEFIDTLSRHHEKTKSAESFLALKDIFAKLEEQHIIDTMDDAIAYVAFDDKNNKVDMYKAAQMMQNGETVIFKERTLDAIRYINNNSDEAPKEEFTGRLVEFQGTELKRTVDAPNPVLATLAKLTPEDELAAAKLWFKDMLENIKEQGSIDPEQKYDTFRFKQMDIGGHARQNVIRNEFIGIPQPDDPLNYDLDSSTALKDFNDEQKLTMFRAAREGKLILNAPTMYLPGAKGIYVKNDGTFGITASLEELTTENNGLNTAIKEDTNFLEKSIPNANNALQLATQLGDFARASNSDLGINSDLSENLRLETQKEKIYETTLLKDIAENPQFYKEKNIRDARIQLINNYITVVTTSGLTVNDPIVIEAQKHDLVGYRGTVNTIAPLINNSLIAPVDPNSTEKISPDEAIKKYADMGLIKFGKGRDTFLMNEKGDMPWDLVDKINYHLGKEDPDPIYITTASHGKIKDYRLTLSGETIKVKEVMPLEILKRATEEIARLREQLNQTGTSRGDSEEFKKLSNFLNSKSFDPISETKDDFMKDMTTLSQLSFNYSFAKLDQSQNTRRMARFETACQIQNIAESFIYGESPLDSRELSKRIVASKATKQFLSNLAKSSDKRAKAFAQTTLKSKTAFDDQIDILMRSGTFTCNFNNLDDKQLTELSKKSASSLAKQVIDAKAGYKHDSVGDCLEKIEKSSITLGSDTAVVNSYMSGFMAANDNPEMSKQKVAVEILNGNPYQKAASREGISSLAICSMLSQGCSFEDAFNPKLFTEEKNRAFNEAVELLKKETPENTKKIAGYYKVAMDRGLDFFNKKAANIDFSNPTWVANGDNWKLVTYCKFMQSIIQEYNKTEGLLAEFNNLYNSPKDASDAVDLQICINDFLNKGFTSLQTAYELENGINDPTSGKTHVEPELLVDTFVQSKIFRESYKQVQEQGVFKKPSEIINQISTKIHGAAPLTNAMNGKIKIMNSVGSVLRKPGKARAIGKDFIDGKFDKCYSVGYNPKKPEEGLKQVGFIEALSSIKEVKLPSSVQKSAPRKEEITKI